MKIHYVPFAVLLHKDLLDPVIGGFVGTKLTGKEGWWQFEIPTEYCPNFSAALEALNVKEWHAGEAL